MFSGLMRPAFAHVRIWLSAVGPVVTLLTVCTWAVLIPTMIQPAIGDYGVFVSVAERLLAGDVLYAGVWDNKDPLVYLTLALARWVSPFGGWIIDVVALILVAIASASIARSVGLNWRSAVLVGGACVPIIVTGLTDPATPNSASVSFALLALACAMRDRWFLSGGLIVVGGLFKATVLPVSLALVAVILITHWSVRRGLRLGAGLAVVALAISSVLFVRSELAPYAQSLLLNVAYSRQGQDLGGLASVISHLRVTVFNPIMIVSLSAGALAVLLGTIGIQEYGSSSPSTRRSVRTLALAAISAGLVAAAVLALTGKWPGHARILAIPLSLALIVAVAGGPSWWRRRLVLGPLSIVLLTFLLAGAPSIAPYVTKLVYARANLSSLSGPSVESAAMSRLASPTSYARVGEGDDPAHARGLTRWTLACPRLTQYWWESESQLDETIQCLDQAQVLLIVPPRAGAQTSEQLEKFRASVKRVVDGNYTCLDETSFRVCRKD